MPSNLPVEVGWRVGMNKPPYNGIRAKKGHFLKFGS
jgi:hypothetical protein